MKKALSVALACSMALSLVACGGGSKGETLTFTTGGETGGGTSGGETTAPPQEGVTLIFDRPFLYGIVDLQNGVPLFLGTFEGL